MCSHYEPVIKRQQLKLHFNVDEELAGIKNEMWPSYIGPFIRKHEHADVGDDAVPYRELLPGAFGLIPHWAKDPKAVKNTFNARSETVDSKPSFQLSWKKGRHCIIPAEAFYEPDWRSGRAVSTRIVRTDGKPMGIAGIWSEWRHPETREILHSFSMLTINADEHPLMKHFHEPGKEKRMIPAC